jgi:hypothetical protein
LEVAGNNKNHSGAAEMPRKRTTSIRAFGFVLASFLCTLPAFAFHGGHTGVSEMQIKNACPAFSFGAVSLVDSVSPPGNLPMTDVFEHESGARCTCTRQRSDRFSARCGPAASVPRPRG